ncbi:MAG: toprim domain-containing protein [Clostridia bacterium]
MAKYIHFTDDEKQRANSVDLEDFLKSKGEKLIKSGREKRLESNHSITVRGNTWFDHATEKGGYSIDFVKKFYNLEFTEAVTELLGNTNMAYRSYEKQAEKPKEFKPPQKNLNNRKVFAYLTKHRCIDTSVLTFFIKEKLIYESKEFSRNKLKEYNNAVFVGLDKDKNQSHIHKRSIFSFGKRFVQNIEGCNPKHSFNCLGGSDRLYVFESPIDMLSFISLHKDTNWKQHNYVALCGVSSQAMMYQMENQNINHVVFCLDNDDAGQKAIARLEKLVDEKGLSHSTIVPDNKDFNEDLVESLKPSQPTQTCEMVIK